MSHSQHKIPTAWAQITVSDRACRHQIIGICKAVMKPPSFSTFPEEITALITAALDVWPAGLNFLLGDSEKLFHIFISQTVWLLPPPRVRHAVVNSIIWDLSGISNACVILSFHSWIPPGLFWDAAVLSARLSARACEGDWIPSARSHTRARTSWSPTHLLRYQSETETRVELNLLVLRITWRPWTLLTGQAHRMSFRPVEIQRWILTLLPPSKGIQQCHSRSEQEMLFLNQNWLDVLI